MRKIITTIVLGLSFCVQAQQELSLSDAINYALQNKAEAVKSRLDVENSEYQIAEVRANALPHINVQGGLTYNAILQESAINFGGQQQIIKMGKDWQSNVAVALNQELFNLSVFTGLQAARTTREFYIINAKLTEEQVIEKVASAYYEVYKTKSQLKTLESTVENTTRIREVISSLYDNGLAKKIDLDRINVTLNNLKSGKNKLENGLELQENALKYLIGMNPREEITLPEQSFELSKEVFVSEDFSVETRTEIALMKKQGELLELNKKAIQAQAYPSLSLSAQYGYSGLGDEFPIFRGQPEVYWSDFSSIGLKLNIPIFNGGVINAKVKQADVALRKLEIDQEDTVLALDLALKNAMTQINNSMITVRTQKENMQLAKEVLKNIENNYKFGLASLTDLVDAETSYADAQNNYTNALVEYKLAEIELIKAKGELKTLIKK